MLINVSVTRLGDLLDFGQLFKARGNNKFAQISHILRQFLVDIWSTKWRVDRKKNDDWPKKILIKFLYIL